VSHTLWCRLIAAPLIVRAELHVRRVATTRSKTRRTSKPSTRAAPTARGEARVTVIVPTGERFAREIPAASVGTRRVATVEIWIGGRCFVTDASSDEHARTIAVETAKALGL
jgi:hypothetical protein